MGHLLLCMESGWVVMAVSGAVATGPCADRQLMSPSCDALLSEQNRGPVELGGTLTRRLGKVRKFLTFDFGPVKWIEGSECKGVNVKSDASGKPGPRRFALVLSEVQWDSEPGTLAMDHQGQIHSRPPPTSPGPASLTIPQQWLVLLPCGGTFTPGAVYERRTAHSRAKAEAALTAAQKAQEEARIARITAKEFSPSFQHRENGLEYQRPKHQLSSDDIELDEEKLSNYELEMKPLLRMDSYAQEPHPPKRRYSKGGAGRGPGEDPRAERLRPKAQSREHARLASCTEPAVQRLESLARLASCTEPAVQRLESLRLGDRPEPRLLRWDLTFSPPQRSSPAALESDEETGDELKASTACHELPRGPGWLTRFRHASSWVPLHSHPKHNLKDVTKSPAETVRYQGQDGMDSKQVSIWESEPHPIESSVAGCTVVVSHDASMPSSTDENSPARTQLKLGGAYLSSPRVLGCTAARGLVREQQQPQLCSSTALVTGPGGWLRPHGSSAPWWLRLGAGALR
ncbi:hypothetical protein CB1_000503002 [Camelus ferus]|nr:hypothetical protein CB1_000589041 [Camelus ferus]EPY84129.1 hypothetical protein CB1_000503002 [Camelus ferus]